MPFILVTNRLAPVGGCNFDDGYMCDWKQSTGDNVQYYFDSLDIYANFQTGPPHDHSGGDQIPDKDCKRWTRGDSQILIDRIYMVHIYAYRI